MTASLVLELQVLWQVLQQVRLERLILQKLMKTRQWVTRLVWLGLGSVQLRQQQQRSCMDRRSSSHLQIL